LKLGMAISFDQNIFGKKNFQRDAFKILNKQNIFLHG